MAGLIHNYLNLTNGLERYTEIENPKLVRIQSTWLEQHEYNKLLSDLDYDFVFNLALGKIGIVHDASSQPGPPRSIWQGIPFIEYVLNRLWLCIEKETWNREVNVTNYVREVYDFKIVMPTFSKLKYFLKFISPDLRSIAIGSSYWQTSLDGKYKEMAELVF